jgi:ATP-dependent RNA helicase DDX47/RRP3
MKNMHEGGKKGSGARTKGISGARAKKGGRRENMDADEG